MRKKIIICILFLVLASLITLNLVFPSNNVIFITSGVFIIGFLLAVVLWVIFRKIRILILQRKIARLHDAIMENIQEGKKNEIRINALFIALRRYPNGDWVDLRYGRICTYANLANILKVMKKFDEKLKTNDIGEIRDLLFELENSLAKSEEYATFMLKVMMKLNELRIKNNEMLPLYD